MTQTRGRPAVSFLMAVAAVSALLASIAIHVQNEVSGLTVGTASRSHPTFPDDSMYADEEERLRLVNNELHGRCDVASVLMRSPTIWVVKCRSAERVVLLFATDGKLEQAASLQALTSSPSPSDEYARRRLFEELLGSRCGILSSTRMESPGRWTANCQNGRRYRLMSQNGNLRVTAEYR